MSLGKFRDEIDEIDSQLLELFQKRMDVVKQVAEYKLKEDQPVLHPDREKEIITKRTNQAKEEYKEYVQPFYENMMSLSRKLQEKLIKDKKKPL